MKFEKINNKKFSDFAETKVTFPQSVYGGYPGETSTTGSSGSGTASDQIKSNNGWDQTDDPSGVANDGFSMVAPSEPIRFSAAEKTKS